MTRLEYADALLKRTLGVSRRGARRALVTVMIAESGHAMCDGVDGAKFNPLNSSEQIAGSTDFNSVPVQNYPTLGASLAAVSANLSEPRYVELRKVLGRKFVSTEQVLKAWAASPWGPQVFDALDEVLKTTYRPDKSFWNSLHVGP